MEQIQAIAVDKIVPSPFNPRKQFSTKEMGELAESIKLKGILEPLLLRFARNNDGKAEYQLVAGERRFRAAEMLELKTVPAIVRDMTDEEARETQIIENLQRQDIAPLEEAQAFQDLLKLHNGKLVNVLDDNATKLDVQTLAKRVGKSKEYVYHRLHLLKLAAPARKALEKGTITPAHAQELAPLPAETQSEIVDQVLHGGYSGKDEPAPVSVAELRDEIRYRTRPAPAPPKISAKEKARRAKEAAAAKKRQAAYARQAAKAEAERKIEKQVNAKALPALWEKLKSGKHEARLVEWIVQAYAERGHDLGEAILIAQGKPVPDGYVRADNRYLHKQPRTAKIALVALGLISDRCYSYKESEPYFRAFGVDRKKIRAQILTEAKAKASPTPIADGLRKLADVGKPKAKPARGKHARRAHDPRKRPAGKRKASR